MVYSTKKCPNCEKTIEFMKARGLTGYGSKIQQCPVCGASYYDDDYVEIEVDGVRFADRCKIEPFKLLGIALIVLALFLGRDSANQTAYFVCGVILVLLLIFSVKDYLQWEKKKHLIDKERAASVARLSNINYAQLLVSKGKNVPKKYLLHQENIVDYNTSKKEK